MLLFPQIVTGKHVADHVDGDIVYRDVADYWKSISLQAGQPLRMRLVGPVLDFEAWHVFFRALSKCFYLVDAHPRLECWAFAIKKFLAYFEGLFSGLSEGEGMFWA